jgi:hypothetical protein
VQVALLLGALAGLAACSGDDGGPAPGPAFVYITRDGGTVDSVMHLTTHGTIRLGTLILDASRRELAPGGMWEYVWSSSNPGVATVIAGEVSIQGDGSALIVARAGHVADTVRLDVKQEATAIALRQDTIVALVEGATRLTGSTTVEAALRDTIVVHYQTVDTSGEPFASTVPITHATAAGAPFALVPNALGTELRIIGTRADSGRIVSTFRADQKSVAVQVASRYAIALFRQGGFNTIMPGPVTIPAGAAVVFANGDIVNIVVQGNGWRVGPMAPGTREAQLFTAPGTYTYTVGMQTVTVTVVQSP